MNRRLLVVAVLLVSSTAAAAALAGRSTDLAAAKSATAKFQNVAAAKADGYGILLDAKKIACISMDSMPAMGAMGIHYAKGSYVGDAKLDPLEPEALVYEPLAGGKLKLAALEYVVFKAAWDAHHAQPPALFGHTFNTTPKPNRFGLPAFYSLHAWVWKHNPAGEFAMWNPNVSCKTTKH